MNIEDIKTTNIGGLDTACIGRKDLVELISSRCADYSFREKDKPPLLIVDNNGQAISLANRDCNLKELLQKADLIHADGQSIVWFSRWLPGKTIPERTATTDMIHDIPKLNKTALNHYLLGAERNVVMKAADVYSRLYGNVRIAGYHHGYFDEAFESELCELINQFPVDILWVGMGKPREQEFCIRNRNRLNVAVIITCGGCFNFLTGDYKRAPLWVQKIGFEWLHRLFTNPGHLFFRYLFTNPHAIFCVLLGYLKADRFTNRK
ncbi:MAG: N-acetylglucosaminyldiphosphoundecaprenol N-acetyl-beta-D-mannosaminyltransferase [Gammaproteobacteria bacterium]|jgi:N-acetylglucosaminyldiphosphoundecaprenol N-acetyl-beta-D-mannosaminyltransferase